jgi:hypothetical protein
MEQVPMKIDEVYLPFTADQLRECFDFTVRNGDPIARFLASARRYREREVGSSPETDRRAHQIEKDETFWTAATLLSFQHHPDAVGCWIELFTLAFGDVAPIPGPAGWEECLSGELKLYLEVGLSSPDAYRIWLREHLGERQLIPHLQTRGQTAPRLEGRTHLDGMLIGPKLAVHFEAKVTSDIDTKVTFDLLRNQIARNVDAMLEPPGKRLRSPLRERDPARSLFVLLTPEMFKREESRRSRLYGWLMREYMEDRSALARDLPHRTEIDDWEAVRRRLGWLTWEDCNNVLPGACSWLEA